MSGRDATGAAVAAGDGGTLTAGPYWYRAETAVIAMMAVVAVRIHEFFPGISVVKPVFTVSILGMILLYRNTAPDVRSNMTRHPLSVLVYLYFGAVCLTIPFALWMSGAIEMARSLLPAVLLFAAMQLVPPTRQTLDRLQFAFIVLVLFFAWYLQTFGGRFRGRLISVSGTYDENDVASILAMTLPIAIALLMRIDGVKKKVGAGLAILAIVVGVMAGGSRGGTLALVAGAMIFVFGMNATKATLILFFMGLGGGAAWLAAPPVFKNRMRSLQNLDNDYNLTAETGRKAVWRRGRQYIRQYPVLGVGAGNFFVAEGNYNEATGVTGKWSAAHNAYVQAFAELGMVGGTLFVLMLLGGMRMALPFWRQTSYARGPPFHRPEFLASLVAFSVGGVFLSHAYFSPLFAILGFVVLAQRVREAERSGGFAASPAAFGATMVAPRGERGGLTDGVRGPARAGAIPWTGRGGLAPDGPAHRRGS